MESNDLLFSRRCQSVYDHLGVFAFMYADGGNSGIERKDFIEATKVLAGNAEEIISLLIENNVITEQDGVLHLNLCSFEGMTMWDLLLICEPWMVMACSQPGQPERFGQMKEMVHKERLSDMYESARANWASQLVPTQ